MTTLDLSLSPYKEYASRLESLRSTKDEWERLAFSKVEDPERGTYDRNERDRARIVQLLFLSSRTEDLDLVRFLLQEEIHARRADSFQGAGDTLSMLSLLLIEAAAPQDVPLFWAAKSSNFDTWAGGYDIEFVFAAASEAEVLRQLAPIPDALESLKKYDLQEVCAGLPEWRSRMVRFYPRRLEDMDSRGLEGVAELFGDSANVERLGLSHAATASDRARLFRRIGKFDKSYPQWVAAAQAAGSAWDTISSLTDAMEDAAKAGIETSGEAVEVDRLRQEIDSWRTVGLGRMATAACLELASATTTPEFGMRLWRLGCRWMGELESFPLVGLRAARAAASMWGEPADVEAIDRKIVAEEAEIEAMFGPDSD